MGGVTVDELAEGVLLVVVKLGCVLLVVALGFPHAARRLIRANAMNALKYSDRLDRRIEFSDCLNISTFVFAVEQTRTKF